MMEQIPRAPATNRAGVRFKDLYVERVNNTLATQAMFEQAVLELVRE